MQKKCLFEKELPCLYLSNCVLCEVAEFRGKVISNKERFDKLRILERVRKVSSVFFEYREDIFYQYLMELDIRNTPYIYIDKNKFVEKYSGPERILTFKVKEHIRFIFQKVDDFYVLILS